MSTVKTINILHPSGSVNNIVNDASGNVTVGGNLTASSGTMVMGSSFLRNRIINGAMMIDQRNAGASVTPTASETYTLDRWCAFTSAASKFSVQQNAGSVTPPAGFTNYLGVTSLTAFSLGATDYCLVAQRIEGFNTSDLAFGTANAKTVTLSFWVRSSLTGTFGGALSNNSNYSYPFTYTISSANTWEQKTITIAGPTAGTWATNNTASLVPTFSLGAGSSFLGTAGSWASTNYLGATGQTNMVSTNGATWYVTGVQLEVGSVATPFERRQYGQELALCQRYYVKQNDPSATSAFMPAGTGYTFNTTDATIQFNLPVTMRTRPTTVNFSNIRIFQASNGAGPALTSVLNNMGTPSVWMADVRASAGGLTSGNIVQLQGNNNTAAYAEFSAEL